MKEYYEDNTMLTNSMIGRLIENDVLFTAYMHGKYTYETTQPMIIGNVIHWHVFNEISGGSFDEDKYKTKIVNDFDRRNKAGKEMYIQLQEETGGDYIKQSEFDDAMMLVDRFVNDKFSSEYWKRLKGEYVLSFEEVSFNELYGVACKGKKDITCRDIEGNIVKVVDLKTTSDILKFRYSVYKYGYHRQAAFYASLDELFLEDDVFDFWVGDKKSGMINVFKTNSPEFSKRCYSELKNGIELFINWSGDEIDKIRTVML